MFVGYQTAKLLYIVLYCTNMFRRWNLHIMSHNWAPRKPIAYHGYLPTLQVGAIPSFKRARAMWAPRLGVGFQAHLPSTYSCTWQKTQLSLSLSRLTVIVPFKNHICCWWIIYPSVIMFPSSLPAPNIPTRWCPSSWTLSWGSHNFNNYGLWYL